MFEPTVTEWVAALYSLIQIGGILSIFHVLRAGRTSEGTVAWSITLALIPLVALPCYWIFGSRTYRGYIEAMRRSIRRHQEEVHLFHEGQSRYEVPDVSKTEAMRIAEKIGPFRFTQGNDVRLLIDGEVTFQAIFEAIDAAKSYILIQSFIINSDPLGQELFEKLYHKARSGVRIYLLFDEVGSRKLWHSDRQKLIQSGIHIRPFIRHGSWFKWFRINFRNHRKIVVVDGETAFVGGHNIGDEYIHRHRKLTPWRDTHIQLWGPSVQLLQSIFAVDWSWVDGDFMESLCWEPAPGKNAEKQALILPSGPIDLRERGTLYIINAIQSAKDRIWLTSPYLVLDESILVSLEMAVLRGVDVRILTTRMIDHFIVQIAGWVYIDRLVRAGVQIFRYTGGFMHQKVFVVDDDLASIGTVNLDNRSLRLNFEVSALFADREFTLAVAEMLEADFSQSEPVSRSAFRNRSILFQFAAQIARLFSPLL